MIRVRPARRGDVEAIARIHVESWRSAYAGLLPDESLIRMSTAGQARQWRTVVRRADHLHRVFVAADAGPDGETVIGFASCGPARHEKGSARSPNDGEVFTLYVEPDRQGGGAGRALLERCLDTLAGEGRRHALVWVIAGNPSRFFYEAMGGRRIAARRERFAGSDLEMTGYEWDLADEGAPED